MAKRAYRASGQSGDGAIPVLLVATLGAGVVIGAVEGFVSRWFSLLILYPLLVGAVAGAVAAVVIAGRQVRAPALALAIGLLGGFIGQTTLHVVQWQHFKAAVEEKLATPSADDDAQWKALSPEERLDRVLEHRTGSRGFVGYLELSAQEGVEIKRHGSGSGAPMKNEWFWLLFFFEYACAMFAGGAIAFQRAREPFCEVCKRWYEGETIIGFGNGDKPAMKETLAAIERGELSRVSGVLGVANDNAAAVFSVRLCAQCQESDALLIAKRVVKPKAQKPRVTTHYQSLITRAELKDLQQALAPTPAPAS